MHWKKICRNGDECSNISVSDQLRYIHRHRQCNFVLNFSYRILREFKVEWHHGPLKFTQAFIVTPTNELKFKMIPLM